MNADAMPKPGTKAPAFQGKNQAGDLVRLSQFKGRPVVLYFYPRDNTPGCTTEAIGFQEHLAAFEAKGAVVIGVSPDTVASHCGFASKHGLRFHLLADPDHALAERYGVWGEKQLYGRKFMGVQRATVLIGADGKVARVWPKVKAAGHAEEVLRAIG